jgi:hypothetical protein
LGLIPAWLPVAAARAADCRFLTDCSARVVRERWSRAVDLAAAAAAAVERVAAAVRWAGDPAGAPPRRMSPPLTGTRAGKARTISAKTTGGPEMRRRLKEASFMGGRGGKIGGRIAEGSHSEAGWSSFERATSLMATGWSRSSPER